MIEDAIKRVIERVKDKIDLGVNPALLRVNRKGDSQSTLGEALVQPARMALELARGDEKLAAQALTLVHGRANRLRACISLLAGYGEQVTAFAYSVHGQLQFSICTLQKICEFHLAAPDWDEEQMLRFFESIASRARSPREQVRLLRSALELLPEHEGQADEVLKEIDERYRR